MACDHTYINQTVARHGTQRMVDVFPVVATIIIVSMCVSDVLSFMTMNDFEDTITPFVVFGKYIFFCGIVSVYQIVMIIFFCQDSAEGENRYGASPKYEEEPPCVPPEERKE